MCIQRVTKQERSKCYVRKKQIDLFSHLPPNIVSTPYPLMYSYIVV